MSKINYTNKPLTGRFRVMDKPCNTCIFSKNTPISQERFEELRASWAAKGVQQECHKATIEQQHIACRGHFNRWLAGELPYPLDQVQAELGWGNLTREQFLNVCLNMGWITFTNVEAKNE